MTGHTWQIIGLAFILLTVVGPLLLVLLIGITNKDDT